jgi:hypothetical protein
MLDRRLTRAPAWGRSSLVRMLVHAGPLAGALLLSGCLARFEVGSSSDSGTETIGGSETATECGEPCNTDESCVMGECVAPCPIPCDATLEICDDGECVCRFAFTPCGGICVDLRSDPMNCGGCGDACEVGVCDQGNCELGGCQGSTDCDGACVDLEVSPLHCGSCHEACVGDELCIEGECVGYEPIVCRSDLDCRAGICCAIEGQGKICIEGDSCP